VHTTPRLIVNCNNFITINNNVFDLFHINFGRFDGSTMHVFNHPLANGVKLMFTLSVLHIQDIKKLFDKICQQLAKFQKPKYGKKEQTCASP
jgi:hypothetical protein